MLLRRSVDRVANIDSLIFDFDGVLVDVSESIQLVHGVAAEMYFSSLGWTNCRGMVAPADVDAVKLAGGFNNDWDVSAAWQLLYLFKSAVHDTVDGELLRNFNPTVKEFAAELAQRGGRLDSAVAAVRERCTMDEWSHLESQWDRARLVRVFKESYAGDLCRAMYGFDAEYVTGRGLAHSDVPILDQRLLPGALKLGIATGRTAGETSVGLELLNWSHIFREYAIITEDDGYLKPDPRILALAVDRLDARAPMYFGDTPDDMLTARRYNEIRSGMLSCAVLSGMQNPGLKEIFIEQRVDLVADNVNAALVAINRCMGGALCLDE